MWGFSFLARPASETGADSPRAGSAGRAFGARPLDREGRPGGRRCHRGLPFPPTPARARDADPRRSGQRCPRSESRHGVFATWGAARATPVGGLLRCSSPAHVVGSVARCHRCLQRPDVRPRWNPLGSGVAPALRSRASATNASESDKSNSGAGCRKRAFALSLFLVSRKCSRTRRRPRAGARVLRRGRRCNKHEGSWS